MQFLATDFFKDTNEKAHLSAPSIQARLETYCAATT
jgi:hypothetical protein